MVKLKQLLLNAKKNNKALFACNINDITDIRAVVECASNISILIIFNVSSNAIRYAGLERIFSLYIIEKGSARVPVFIQLDHAKDFKLIDRCINLGFDAIMVDRSDLSFKKNVEFVKKACTLSQHKDVLIEAQLGTLRDTRSKLATFAYTDPFEAENFINKTRADILSISFGNEHNYYLEHSNYLLDFDLLKKSLHY